MELSRRTWLPTEDEMMRPDRPILAASLTALLLSGCAASPQPAATPEASTNGASQSSMPSPTSSGPPSETPLDGARPVTVATSVGITYLTHAGGDSDAIGHPVTFAVDDAGCLRVSTPDFPEAEVPVLNERYSVESDGIYQAGVLVARFGETAIATGTGREDVPDEYYERCGDVMEDAIIGFSPEAK